MKTLAHLKDDRNNNKKKGQGSYNGIIILYTNPFTMGQTLEVTLYLQSYVQILSQWDKR